MADTTVRVVLEEKEGGGAPTPGVQSGSPASTSQPPLPNFTQDDLDKATATQRAFIQAMLKMGQATLDAAVPPTPLPPVASPTPAAIAAPTHAPLAPPVSSAAGAAPSIVGPPPPPVAAQTPAPVAAPTGPPSAPPVATPAPPGQPASPNVPPTAAPFTPPLATPYGPPTTAAPPLPQWLGGPGPPPIPKVPRLTKYTSPFTKGARALHYAGMPTLAGAARGAGQLDEGATGADAVIPTLMVVNAGAKLLTQAIETVRGGIETVGHVTADAAKNDYMGALFKGADAASGALKQIPVYGQALGAAVDLTIAPVKAFSEVINSFVERGREISKYSGPLAGAVAQADVRSLIADIREANELSPQLTSLTNETSQFYDDVRSGLLPLKKLLLDELVLEVRMIRTWLEKYPPEQISEVTGHAAAASVSLYGIYELTKDLLGLGKKFEKEKDAKEVKGIIDDFYNIGDDKLPRPAGDQGAGGPLFPPNGGPF